MNSEKILILTLGTGPAIPSENNEARYRETQYVIDGKPYEKDGAAKKTNFVADPIID